MTARELIKAGAALWGSTLGRTGTGAVSVLTYHRVSGDLPVELDLPFALFERQMEWLARTGRVVAYREAIEALLDGKSGGELRYVLTFDDAYADFHARAWPVLRRHRLPATLFVPTGFIDDPRRLPLSRHLPEAVERMKPMSWDQVREVAADPRVTIGGHTHTHPELDQLSDAAIEREMTRSAERFQSELGFVPGDFAYPRGVWNPRVAAVVSRHCETAAIVGGALATARNTQRYRIPRVPVRHSDGWRWFPWRVRGHLYPEERLIALVKRLRGRSASY